MGEQVGDDDELFGPVWLNKCLKEAGNVTEGQFLKLGNRLRAFAQPFRTQIASVPSHFPSGPENIDISKQRDWLESDVIFPAAKLKKALSAENRHFFKSVMFDLSDFAPDFNQTMKLLDEIEDFAEAAFIQLDMQVTNSIRNSSQLQFEIVTGIVEMVEEDLILYENRMSTRANALVRIAFTEITGSHKQLDDDIKLALKRVKKNPRGNEPS